MKWRYIGYNTAYGKEGERRMLTWAGVTNPIIFTIKYMSFY